MLKSNDNLYKALAIELIFTKSTDSKDNKANVSINGEVFFTFSNLNIRRKNTARYKIRVLLDTDIEDACPLIYTSYLSDISDEKDAKKPKRCKFKNTKTMRTVNNK